jgi:hypothetical protein
MRGTLIDAQAYRSSEDLERARNPIAAVGDAHLAIKYKVTFRVPTLIGPGPMADATTIGFDLSTGNYPFSEPATWIISPHVPYSPHFKKGAPVCIGEIWKAGKGRMLLGQLFVHIAKLLNWEEVSRGGGYVGWNGAAIDYHARVFGGKPITPGLVYPALPIDITHGPSSDAQLFAGRARGPAPRLGPTPATGHGSDVFVRVRSRP